MVAAARQLNMTVIHERYRIIRELSPTLYGWVFACEDMQQRMGPAPPAANISAVAIKQVSLERMTNFMQDHPCDGHTPDNPVVERELGDLLRAIGGHPNLIQYQDSFVEQQTMYLVMEHCAGGDMYDYLRQRRQRTLSCTNALSVLSQVAAGLAFLHDHGIAHRDVSLENIMLHHGRCKLGDFGLATRAPCVGGRHVGKKYYMAPEVVAGSMYNPKTADVWSLGIVLFIMLTGSPLVSLACTSVKSFRALKQAGVSRVLDAWGVTATMSTNAIALLSGMLETDPHKRLTINQVLNHHALKDLLC
ncbi:hypothetical protein BBO99_00003698 [Phytophthora kernoviae]|uniref:Protein kinase domain-containing protein n=2 Tax=Phytophthora kernoviae TaxID=325452 RepID=A0A3R7FWM8_9STRA|nr:hypothetical protein G195_005226 [Phytophthora kernoviae 00238/432]KAG2523877.1 hypothetical protein JM16_003203 [Phytophthora kernoviae]KAG2525695.1 hypothetical protein JM18_003073 [Phytophthora kernoviae]RLN02577.1 hypothetical protein BBI17_003422 [Phytophthora kernoviae]RLN81449.1 hypothetical protein BBO99_00003698 [Phytophthora kernoviae]